MGVTGANAECEAQFAGSHACHITELQSAAEASELAGIEDIDGATVTSFWAIDPARSNVDQCGVTVPWDYQTAHTGQFADVVTLNNDTGELGAVTENNGCFQQRWVGCCSGSPTQQVFTATCNLADDSELNLVTSIITLPLVPTGQFSVSCAGRAGATSGLDADLSCTCDVDHFDSAAIPGIGDVCIEPSSPCEARSASCDGSTGADVVVEADHNIGECTSTADCASRCDTHCGDLGAGFFNKASTCEDLCLGGPNDGEMCIFDSECPDGSCGGRDGGQDGQICECVCAQTGAGGGTTGSLACGLGVAITIELDADQICGNTPPGIVLMPLCAELTTGMANGVILNSGNEPGRNIGPSTLTGDKGSCSDLASGSVSGTTFVGHLPFFGSAIGDLLVETVFACE